MEICISFYMESIIWNQFYMEYVYHFENCMCMCNSNSKSCIISTGRYNFKLSSLIIVRN